MSTGILTAHQFDEKGTSNNTFPGCGVDKDNIKLPQSEITKAIEEAPLWYSHRTKAEAVEEVHDH